MIRKLVVNDGRTERELLLIGTIVVGRDPSCHINDMDPLLSRVHAEFVSNDENVTIRDLRSRNGILVNGVKVPERALKPGDVVQLGHLHVRYVEEHPVLTKEQESRSHATTTTGTVPTMAVPRLNEVVPPLVEPPSIPLAATAPTEKAPIPSVPGGDQDITRVPAARAKAAPPPRRPAREDDPDATRAPGVKAPPATPVGDLDETAAPGVKAPPAKPSYRDLDATLAPSAETRAVIAESAAITVAVKAAATSEARVVANSSLIVTEASPSCQQIIGVRPETIVGGRLEDALTRSLSFVTSGDGPSSLSLTVTRASSGRTITITFKAGQATETRS